MLSGNTRLVTSNTNYQPEGPWVSKVPNLGLSVGEKARIVLLYAIVASATLGGFSASLAIGQSYAVLAGLGVAAFVFGVRHGFDADHIAAIDNTVRKLLQEGKRPLTVGAWFSLGHSTVVFVLIIALMLGTKSAIGAIPMLQSAGSLLGTAISGVFLYVIGLVNLVLVAQVRRTFRAMRAAGGNETDVEDSRMKSGFMVKYFGRLFALVRSPWQVYPIGLLFGLGFDTASEVALIAISVGAGVSSAVPVWSILTLPLMFACGMVLVDTTDGLAMQLAYGWAFLKPLRKVYYNLTVTLISVMVAFLIGSIELAQVVAGEVGLAGGFWNIIQATNFETLGGGIVAIFVVSWIVSLAYYRLKRFEVVPSRDIGLRGNDASE